MVLAATRATEIKNYVLIRITDRNLKLNGWLGLFKSILCMRAWRNECRAALAAVLQNPEVVISTSLYFGQHSVTGRATTVGDGPIN